MADQNFKVKNGLSIGDNVATYVTKVTINTAAETTLDSILTGTVESVDYSLTLYQGAGVISKKYLATENGTVVSTQEYASSSVNRAEFSAEAFTWTTRTSNFGNTQILSVAYGNNLWVATGNYGELRTSTDAITWTTRTSNFGVYSIMSVGYANSLWVAGSTAGLIRTSTNGTTWTTRTSNFGSTSIRSIDYGNNLWVAAGYYGEIRTSTDAITWVTQTSNFTSTIRSVAYGNSLWVAGGTYGQLRTSVDSDKVIVTATVTDANVTTATSKATLVLTEE
jgi:hypothetical protein